MTSVRLEAVRPTAFDAGVARLGSGRFTRAGGITYLQTDGPLESTKHELALTGVRVVACDLVPIPAGGQRLAMGLDLVPLDSAIPALDVVEVTRVALSEATAVLMHRRLRWLRPPSAARSACRRLLRNEDTVLAWRRFVWCSIDVLRAAKSTHVRAVVFDSEALHRRPPRWTYATQDAIGRWAFS